VHPMEHLKGRPSNVDVVHYAGRRTLEVALETLLGEAGVEKKS
jgi:hypothetical protein